MLRLNVHHEISVVLKNCRFEENMLADFLQMDNA